MHLIEPYGTKTVQIGAVRFPTCTVSFLHYQRLHIIFIYKISFFIFFHRWNNFYLSYLPIANFLAIDCVSLNYHRLFSLTSNKKDEVEPARKKAFSLNESYSLRKCRMHCKFRHNEHCFISLNNIFCFKANNCRTFL